VLLILKRVEFTVSRSVTFSSKRVVAMLFMQNLDVFVLRRSIGGVKLFTVFGLEFFLSCLFQLWKRVTLKSPWLTSDDEVA
jgi:hypothetical protein